VSSAECDVAIVGAGPYGLACAAHLRAANGLTLKVFGHPMSSWDEQMPKGMLLRSPYVASNIGPDGALSLDAYQAATRVEVSKPVPVERFVSYGRWVQEQVAPDLDHRLVGHVERNGRGFKLELEGGEIVRAGRVVVAAGIVPFAWRPPEFRELPHELASHAAEHPDLSVFRGKRVAVVGGGQSALESAALLRENGADPEVLVRHERIYFLRRAKGILHRLGPVTRLLFAPAEVGPAGISRLVSTPNAYRRMPRKIQDRFAVRSLRPAGAAWLVPRLEGVPIDVERAVVLAREVDGGVELTLTDGSRRAYDHVLLATGYSVDIANYGFLPERLLQAIARVNGHPRLARGFESSVPGLYFVGAPSAWSYGPLMRFVAGTEFTAPVLAQAIVGARGGR
jgi:cation diffusion facilitator CzcD-associated flavoprotein CzcO